MVFHIGFIMDGNRRFAKKLDNTLKDGYRAGMQQFLDVVKFCVKNNITHSTYFAMSNDNYEKRDNEELNPIKEIATDFFNKDEIEEFFVDNKVKLTFRGKEYDSNSKDELEKRFDKNKEDKDFLKRLQKRFDAYNKKIQNPVFYVHIAFNYDGQEEIAHACSNIVKKGIKDITPQTIKDEIYFNDVPAPEIIVRPGDAPRLSGFLLFDSKYSEIYFTKKYWPELTDNDLTDILTWFDGIKRNFGK